MSVDTPDETDKSLVEDDLQKNLAFLLDRVEGCSVRCFILCWELCSALFFPASFSVQIIHCVILYLFVISLN